jgi:hypothetical protein
MCVASLAAMARCTVLVVVVSPSVMVRDVPVGGVVSQVKFADAGGDCSFPAASCAQLVTV